MIGSTFTLTALIDTPLVVSWTADADCQAKHPQCKVALQESKSGHRVMGTGVQTFTTKARADTIASIPLRPHVCCALISRAAAMSVSDSNNSC